MGLFYNKPDLEKSKSGLSLLMDESCHVIFELKRHKKLTVNFEDNVLFGKKVDRFI